MKMSAKDVETTIMMIMMTQKTFGLGVADQNVDTGIITGVQT